MESTKIPEVIQQVEDVFDEIVRLGGGTRSSPNVGTLVGALATAYLKSLPFKKGDRIELARTLNLDNKPESGWYHCRKTFTKGNPGTIIEVQVYASSLAKVSVAYTVRFDKTWHYDSYKEKKWVYKVGDDHCFSFGAEGLIKVLIPEGTGVDTVQGHAEGPLDLPCY